MAIKRGVPLEQTGMLDGTQLTIARALSITTVEELAGLLLTADPEEVRFWLPTGDLPGLVSEAMRMASYPVAEDLQRVRELSRDRGTGALPPTEFDRERRSELLLAEAEVRTGNPGDKPEVFLESCLGPVRHQGDRGTCVAHAVVAVLECLEAHRVGTRVDLSEQFLYWLCKMNDGDPHESGTWQRVAVPLAVEWGVCEEQVWPYSPVELPGNESHGPPPNRQVAIADAARHLPTQGVFLKGVIETIKARLDAGHCLAISVPTFSNWADPTVEREGHIKLPLPNKMPDGGHAMCVVGYGYSDEFTGGGYVIVRNSWGDSWAYQSPFRPGYGTLPFAYVSQYCWELTTFD